MTYSRYLIITVMVLFRVSADLISKSNIITKLGLSAATKYSSYLNKYPMITNVVTASALTVLSDSVAQRIELSSQRLKNQVDGTVPRHSFYRSFCMAAVYGAAVFGYFVRHWYRFLDMLVPTVGITIPLIALKVTINQVCMSPFLNTLFFGYVTFTRDLKSTVSEKIVNLKLKLKNDLMQTIYRSCGYWGVVQASIMIINLVPLI